MKQLIIGVDIDRDDALDRYHFKVIKGEEVSGPDEWLGLDEEDLADRFNIKLCHSSRKFENINYRNEKIRDFDTVITCVNAHIDVYFKRRDY